MATPPRTGSIQQDRIVHALRARMRFYPNLALARRLLLSHVSDTGRPRIAVGGLSAESNSLYPATNPMLEAEASRLPRAQWLGRTAKASTVASGVIAAASKLDIEVVPVLQ